VRACVSLCGIFIPHIPPVHPPSIPFASLARSLALSVFKKEKERERVYTRKHKAPYKCIRRTYNACAMYAVARVGGGCKSPSSNLHRLSVLM
jgi:hypothetical protein